MALVLASVKKICCVPKNIAVANGTWIMDTNDTSTKRFLDIQVLFIVGVSRYDSSLPLTNQNTSRRVWNSMVIEPQMLERRCINIPWNIIIHQHVSHESLDLSHSKETTRARNDDQLFMPIKAYYKKLTRHFDRDRKQYNPSREKP